MVANEETIEWLREFMSRLNSQDNRATATPYYYQLRCPVRIDNVGESGTFEWRDEDHDTIDDIIVYLRERAEDDDLFAKYARDKEINLTDLNETDNYFDVSTLTEHLGISKNYYRMSEKYKGMFLTEKAALEHLEENKHNYPTGTCTYLDHAYRNPELLSLLEHIGKLVGVPYERK